MKKRIPRKLKKRIKRFRENCIIVENRTVGQINCILFGTNDAKKK